MQKFVFSFLLATVAIVLIIVTPNPVLAENVSFRRVEVPDVKGHHPKAVLTLDDTHKAIEAQPAKGDAISIPYSQIDKVSYEYTQKHRVNEVTIATAPIGIGVVLMLTKSKSHWLQIDYHEGEQPHVFVVRMDKRDYVRILDAVKAHAGIEAQVLGNAQKR